MIKKTKWTEEVIQFMIDNYQGKDNIELAEMLNEKFNLNTNADRVSNEKSKLKRLRGINLQTGINRGCIKKGNVPKNKGLKWNDYLSKESQEKCRKTTFKKGNIPHNHKKIGSERINVDGYVEIKVAEPNMWELKHRVIYESMYGNIPTNSKVIFLDNDKSNLNIDNLKCIKSSEELIMNQNKLRYSNKNLTESGYLIAKIMDKAKVRK